VLLADVDHDLLGADGLRGQDRAIDHEVRAVGHEGAVLGASRLALGAVHDDDRAAVGAFRDRPPLAAHGKARPTATEQAARFEGRDEVASGGLRRDGPKSLEVLGVGLRPGRGRRTCQESSRRLKRHGWVPPIGGGVE
jgi:hypothetical protein